MSEVARAIIALLTDFGAASPYVAQMKGVILAINPAAVLVDVTHAIRPQDIAHGAWVLAEVADSFSPGSIHVAVVDPGVGSEREIDLRRDRRATVHRAGQRFARLLGGPDESL